MSDFKLPSAGALVDELVEFLQAAEKSGQNIILATGVFDIIHHEHRKFLKKAKELGGKLVVGIESDSRVKKIKGSSRPINPEQQRRASLLKETLADFVFILPDEFSRPEQHRQLIEVIRPDFFAVSSHTSHLDKKRKIIKSVGGQLMVVHEHNPKVSTSKLLRES